MRRLLAMVIISSGLLGSGCATGAADASERSLLVANGTSSDGVRLTYRAAKPQCIYSAGEEDHLIIDATSSEKWPGVHIAVNNTHGFGAFELDQSIENGSLSVAFTRNGEAVSAFAPTAILVEFDQNHEYSFPATSGVCRIRVSRLDGDRVTGELSCTNLSHVVDDYADGGPTADVDVTFDCAILASAA